MGVVKCASAGGVWILQSYKLKIPMEFHISRSNQIKWMWFDLHNQMIAIWKVENQLEGTSTEIQIYQGKIEVQSQISRSMEKKIHQCRIWSELAHFLWSVPFAPTEISICRCILNGTHRWTNNQMHRRKSPQFGFSWSRKFVSRCWLPEIVP